MLGRVRKRARATLGDANRHKKFDDDGAGLGEGIGAGRRARRPDAFRGEFPAI